MSKEENIFIPLGLQSYIKLYGDIQNKAQEESFFYTVMDTVSNDYTNSHYACAPYIFRSVMEGIVYKRGVTIHVSDKELINTLMQCRIDSVLCEEVRMPFPIMSFAFPKHIPILNGQYEISGCVIIDMNMNVEENNLLKLFHSHFHTDMIQMSNSIYGGFFVRRLNSDKYCITHSTIKKSDLLKNNIDNLLNSPTTRGEKIFSDQLEQIKNFDPNFEDIDDNDMKNLLAIHWHLVMSLLLYCQAMQDKRTIVPITPPKMIDHQMSKRMRKTEEARKHYSITNLLSHYKMEKDPSEGGSHASPIPHHRRLTMRSLKNEKYKRNADGSIRIIMVKPCMVGYKTPSDQITSERIVEEV